jgi:hypothetical protein
MTRRFGRTSTASVSARRSLSRYAKGPLCLAPSGYTAGAMPDPIKDWSLTSLKERLIKIGAKVVSHGRYVTFQMAEVAVPRQMFQEILSLIARLRAPPAPA